MFLIVRFRKAFRTVTCVFFPSTFLVRNISLKHVKWSFLGKYILKLSLMALYLVLLGNNQLKTIPICESMVVLDTT